MTNTSQSTARIVFTTRRWVMLLAMTVVLAAGALGGRPVAAQTESVVVHDAGDAAEVSLVGDSTLAGVRWYGDYGSLERFNFVLSAESCRRTIEQSCISREGYRSENVVTAMRSLDGQLGDVLVIMSGYNDPLDTIDEAIAEVSAEARAQGVGHVVWLSLRTSSDVDYSDPQEQSSINTFREYNDQLIAAADASDGFLQIADWATYSLGSTAWFEGDGVHLSRSGVDALTTFLTGTIEQVLSGSDVSPAAAPWTVLVPGAEGERVADVQQAMIEAGIDVPGGADGAFGYDTMAAVAEYQRRSGDLNVTGAVDLATARLLGVYDDGTDALQPVSESPTEPAEAETNRADPAATVRTPTIAGSVSDGGAVASWPVRLATVVALLIASVALRRVHVVARRRARTRPSTREHRERV